MHEQNVRAADVYWPAKAKEKDWECIQADLSVYRYSGKDVKSDPRRTPQYREKVLSGLGFGPGQTKPGLTEADMAAMFGGGSRQLRRLRGEWCPRAAALGGGSNHGWNKAHQCTQLALAWAA